MTAAPFPPLVPGRERDDTPALLGALRERMAQAYGVEPGCVLPVRGVQHGAALACRLAARRGSTSVAGPGAFGRVAEIAGLRLVDQAEPGTGAILVASPNANDGGMLAADDAVSAPRGGCLIVVDESLIEFAEGESLAPVAARSDNLIVLRSLAVTYGLGGDPCGAAIASPDLVATLEDVLEPEAISASTLRMALDVLAPSRAAAYGLRFRDVRDERVRVLERLRAGGLDARSGAGPFVFVTPRDRNAAKAAVSRYAVSGEWRGATFRIDIGAHEANDRALAAFDVFDAGTTRRSAEVVRETLETKVVVRVDLDREGGSTIRTGVGFFDHMLAQVSAHGGFRLTLACDGDLDVDAHHTIEDCAIVLGEALKAALGARRGVARYGFVLPMDEAEASVSIDLGGRPYLVFKGEFGAPLLGEYPTEMTEHVFRSLSQSLGAAIHVSVTGDNDHHKTEACFKAFGRALRQAVRIEGAALPSTKGVIA